MLRICTITSTLSHAEVLSEIGDAQQPESASGDMAEEEDRPFKAEYAKSGRAGCKLCKGAISKDSLRVAKMVQVQSTWEEGREGGKKGCVLVTV